MRARVLGRRWSSLLLGLATVAGALGVSATVPPGATQAGATTAPPTLSTPTITSPVNAATSQVSTVQVSGTAAASTPTVAVVVTVRTSATATTGDWTALAQITAGTWSVPVSLLKGTWYLRALEIDTQGDTGTTSAPVKVSVTSTSAVVNGGFETPAGALHGTLFPTLTGWTPTTGTCPTGHTDEIEIQSPTIYGVKAETGTQYLTIASRCVGGVKQRVATIPGLQYTLSFYYRARPKVLATENVLTAEWGGQHVTPVLQAHTTTTTIVLCPCNSLYTKQGSNGIYKTHWTHATYTVTATTTTTVLQFNDAYTGTPGVSVGAFLDDVSLVPSYARAPPNTRWQTATTIDPSTSGALTFTGEQLWYKFPIAPGEHISAQLTNVPANYQLWMFSDITTLYSALTTAGTALTVTQLEAENPANNDQSASLANGKYYNGKYYNGDFADAKYYNGKYYNGEFADGKYYNGKYYNGKYYNGGHGLTGADSAALADSLVGFSTQQGAVTKSVTADTYNDTGSFYVEVTGVTGAFSPGQSFTLNVSISGASCPLAVTTTFSAGDGFKTTTATVVPVADTSHATYTTLIVDDSQTMPQVAPTYAGPTPVYPALTALATSVHGHVVDVGTSTWVRDQTAQARLNPTCPYDVNLEADAIQKIINTYRQGSDPKNVVLVGDDNVIPFFRDPDQEQVEPEVDYTVPLLSTSEDAAALANNYFLTDDQYGAAISLTINGSTLPVQTAAVGRLVETPSDIVKTVENYLTATTPHKVVKATSALTAGYTFMASGAQQIANQLTAEGVATDAQLITGESVAPSTPASWSATQLLTTLKKKAHQLVFIGAHFNANAMLAANRTSTLTTRTFAAQIGTRLANSIVLSAGCHAGYTIDASNALTYKSQLAWPQAFVESGAALVAGTGFQYGDSNYVAASDQFYADLVQQFGYTTNTASPSLGTALLQTEWRYLAGLDQLSGLDQKSLLQVTLYGLPMLGVKMPTTHATPGVGSSLVSGATSVGNGFTLNEASLTLSGTQLKASPVTVTATGTELSYDNGNNGVLADPGNAVVPVEIDNVNVKSESLRGVGFMGGTYTDSTVALPLTGDPVTQTSAPAQPFSSSVYYPQKIWNPNYFGAIHTGADTELGVTPVQYVRNGGASTATERRFTTLHFKLFYTPNGTTSQDQGAALAAPPSITKVTVTTATTSVTVTATLAPDAAGLQEVWTTYTDPDASSSWTSHDLVQTTSDPTRWTATFHVASAMSNDFMVQAANGEGDVSLDDAQGAFFTPVQSSSAEVPQLAPSSLSLTGTNPTSGAYGGSATLSATFTTSAGSAGGRPISFSVGTTSALAYTNGTGTATTTVPLAGLAPGTYPVTASFTGDSTHAAASAAATFTVRAAATTLVLSAPATITSGAQSHVAATLDANGKPLAQETVHFDVTASTGAVVASSTGTTSKTGVAQAGPLALPAGDVGGGYTVTAYFSTPATPVAGSTTATPRTENAAVVGYAAATPRSAALTVHDATQTTLSASPNPATFGQTVTLTATVDPTGTSTSTWPSAASPAGPTVTFYNGTIVVGTGKLVFAKGVATATFALHGLSGGSHTLKVKYAGATNFVASTGKATEAVGFTKTITSTVTSPLTISAGQVVLVTGTVTAPITVKPGGGLEIDGGTVTAPIRSSGAIGIRLCGATVGGPVSITGSTGFVFIGGTGCAKTTIDGPLSLSKNTAGVEVANSTIEAPVTVTNNKGASPVLVNGSPAGPEIAGNTISGPLSCSGNAPAPTDDQQPNTSPKRGGQCATPANF